MKSGYVIEARPVLFTGGRKLMRVWIHDPVKYLKGSDAQHEAVLLLEPYEEGQGPGPGQKVTLKNDRLMTEQRSYKCLGQISSPIEQHA